MIIIFSETAVGYANDITIVSTSVKTQTESYEDLKNRASAEGLMISLEKTKYLRVSKYPEERYPPFIPDLQIEQSFKYLGSTINVDNNLTTEIKAKTFAANRTYFALSTFFASPSLSKNINISFIKPLSGRLYTYGNETWTLLQVHEDQL